MQSESDRKSTRLNSSHLVISYAVFCLKKKTRARVPPRFAACRPVVCLEATPVYRPVVRPLGASHPALEQPGGRGLPGAGRVVGGVRARQPTHPPSVGKRSSIRHRRRSLIAASSPTPPGLPRPTHLSAPSPPKSSSFATAHPASSFFFFLNAPPPPETTPFPRPAALPV